METKAKVKVIVVGAGIAGPVLATFLKRKGYDPIIYERADEWTEAGLSHAMQPNGLRVLNLIPGLFERIRESGREIRKIKQLSAIDGHEEILVEAETTNLKESTGFPMIGIKRSVLHKVLLTCAEEHGVEIKWGHQAVSFEQREDEVQVTFANGFKDAASFVVGCDGLHSNTRTALFGYEKVDFTGLVQTGGLTRSEHALERDTMLDFFHVGKHMISYAYSDTMNSWAITTREEERKEDWRAQGEETMQAVKTGPLSQWGPNSKASELVKNAELIIKYGLYDRPELKTWHEGRVVLLGDAAHPTSPHLGQGANQSFEDIYHLMRALAVHNPDACQPSTDVLAKVFAEYEDSRIETSAAMVKGARARGNIRVVDNLEESLARNKKVQDDWNDDNLKKRTSSIITCNKALEGKELGPDRFSAA